MKRLVALFLAALLMVTSVSCTFGAAATGEEETEVISYDMELKAKNNYILGDTPSYITAPLMAAWVETKVSQDTMSLACSLQDLAKIFLEEGTDQGVRGDIAFCQSIKETGYFRFGGQVLPQQNNYAGIGAINNSAVGKGAWFESPRIGVRAQIQHLFAYANSKAADELVYDCVDPRFHLVSKGVAVSWTALNGRWAVPGDGYGESILDIWCEMAKYCAEHYAEPTEEVDEDMPSEWAAEAWAWGEDNGLCDGTRPHDALTREELLTILWRYENWRNERIAYTCDGLSALAWKGFEADERS